MEYVVMAVILAFDLLIVKWKFEHKRYADATLDLTLLIIINMVMGGSLGGEIVGTIAACIISLYLLAFPPKLGNLLA